MGLGERGVSLVELMVAMTILTVGVLGFIAAFGSITKSMHVSRARTLATNLAQEKVENLKSVPYYKLAITTVQVPDNNFTPPLYYDDINYGTEIIRIGGIYFKRTVLVAMAIVENDEITSLGFNYPDTGMKAITIHVKWQQNGEWKHNDLSAVYENPIVDPLLAAVEGDVTDGTNPVSGAKVIILENPDWSDTADTSGAYDIRASPGLYSMRASSAGYYSVTVTLVNMSSTTVPSVDFVLARIGTGTVTGAAWIQSGLVISQVVAATNTVAGDLISRDIEYIELFNPTTHSINIGVAGTPDVFIGYMHHDNDSGHNFCGITEEDITYVSTFVPAGKSFLISNASYFMVLGNWVTADAYWNDALYEDRIKENDRGCVYIATGCGVDDNTIDTSKLLDSVAWNKNNGVVFDEPDCVETTQIPYGGSGNGLQTADQIVRISSPLLTSDVYGKAYDSGSNVQDFLYNLAGSFPGIQYRPYTTADSSQTSVAGKPATGANVVADDLLGPATKAFELSLASLTVNIPYAVYDLDGVSTGTWSVIIASGSYVATIENVIVVQNVTTPVPNAATNPSEVIPGHPSAFLSTISAAGYVAGTVTDIGNNPLGGISIQAGANSSVTGANGRYFASAATGVVVVTANPGNANPQYVQSIAQPTIVTGQVTTQDFALTEGGIIMGFISTDGTSILPNVQVAASRGGVQYGLATSDTAGNFYIKNLTTGTYDVAPILDPMESFSPVNLSTFVAPGETVYVGTFTISGALGSIGGTITDTATGELVTSGALIVVSLGAISSPPPRIVASSSAAQTVLYVGSSLADGSYLVEVRGSTTATYNLSAFIPVISGDSVSVTTKTYTGISVAINVNTAHNISIP